MVREDASGFKFYERPVERQVYSSFVRGTSYLRICDHRATCAGIKLQ